MLDSNKKVWICIRCGHEQSERNGGCPKCDGLMMQMNKVINK